MLYLAEDLTWNTSMRNTRPPPRRSGTQGSREKKNPVRSLRVHARSAATGTHSSFFLPIPRELKMYVSTPLCIDLFAAKQVPVGADGPVHPRDRPQDPGAEGAGGGREGAGGGDRVLNCRRCCWCFVYARCRREVCIGCGGCEMKCLEAPFLRQ